MTAKTKIPVLITIGWSAKALIHVDHLDQIALLQSAIPVQAAWDHERKGEVLFPSPDKHDRVQVHLVNAPIVDKEPEPKPTEPEPEEPTPNAAALMQEYSDDADSNNQAGAAQFS